MPATKTGVDFLTRQERLVLSLIRQGLPNKAIAKQLGITLDTARRHSSRIRQKLNLQERDIWPELSSLDLCALHRELTNTPDVHLTARELQILYLIAQGHSSKQISRSLGNSPRTIDKQRGALLAKFGVRSTRELLACLAGQYAMRGIACPG